MEDQGQIRQEVEEKPEPCVTPDEPVEARIERAGHRLLPKDEPVPSHRYGSEEGQLDQTGQGRHEFSCEVLRRLPGWRLPRRREPGCQHKDKGSIIKIGSHAMRMSCGKFFAVNA